MSQFHGGPVPPQQPGPFQPKPPKKPRKWLPYAIAAGTFVLGLVIGAAPSNSATSAAEYASTHPVVTKTVTPPDNGPTPDPVVTPTNKPSPPPAPKFSTPKASDFKLTVKTLTKHCFGSAGCNVTYRIAASWNAAFDPSQEYKVVYEVRGGEDGPAVNTFTVTGDDYSFDSEELLSTKKSSVKLTAVATDVMES